MNTKDRNFLRAHLAAVYDGIQQSDSTATDPYIVDALQHLLEAVRLIQSEVIATDDYLTRIAQP